MTTSNAPSKAGDLTGRDARPREERPRRISVPDGRSSQIGMLFARLQLMHPEVRSVLVAAPRSQLELAPLADELREHIAELGFHARLVDVRGEPRDYAAELPDESQPATSERFTVLLGAGLLDDPATLLSVRTADAVVLVAQRGKTARLDLERARVEVERADGKLAGAVLIQ